MQQIIHPFLHASRFRASTHRSGSLMHQGCISRLQVQMEECIKNSLNFHQEDTVAAEELVQTLYSEMLLLAENEPVAFVRTVQMLWEIEDQGYIPSSSLINDLGIRTLLETYKIKACKSPVLSAFQSMFITASQENKRVLVDAILSFLGDCEHKEDCFGVWSEAIIGSIGKSSMRMNVVESALIEQCTNDIIVASKRSHSVLLCIQLAFSSELFQCEQIKQAVVQKLQILQGHIILPYIRFLQSLGELDIKQDTLAYIHHFANLFKRKRSLVMDAQCAIFNAIDTLKGMSKVNVYKEPYFRVFCDNWSHNQATILVEEEPMQETSSI